MDSYFRVFHDDGSQLRPEGISGRVVEVTKADERDLQSQGTLDSGLLNEFKVGYNRPVAE